MHHEYVYMDIEEAIKSRRSIRKYTPTTVDKDDILAMLEVAMWAPSACNRQAHKVIYIEEEETKKTLVNLGAAPFLRNATAILLFLYEDVSDNIAYDDDIQSSSALIANFLLLAHAKGLGACWTCQLPSKDKLRKMFNIPKAITPIAAVSIGYPRRKPALVPRKYKVEEIFFEESLPSGITIPDRNLILFLKRILRKFYYFLPPSIQKIINPFVNKIFVKKFTN